MLKSRGSARVSREATDLPLENFSYPVGENQQFVAKVSLMITHYIFFKP